MVVEEVEKTRIAELHDSPKTDSSGLRIGIDEKFTADPECFKISKFVKSAGRVGNDARVGIFRSLSE